MHKVFKGRVNLQPTWNFFFFFLSKLHGMWDLSSLTRDLTYIPSIGIAESWPLDHLGSHNMGYFWSFKQLRNVHFIPLKSLRTALVTTECFLLLTSLQSSSSSSTWKLLKTRAGSCLDVSISLSNHSTDFAALNSPNNCSPTHQERQKESMLCKMLSFTSSHLGGFLFTRSVCVHAHLVMSESL